MNLGRVMEALIITEEELGRPAYNLEVFQTMMKTSYLPVGGHGITVYCLMNLMIHDKILINTQSTMCSADMKN
jgi:hypothetical protein